MAAHKLEALYLPPESTSLSRFKDQVNATHGLSLSNYHDLYRWSTENIAEFWSDVWDFTNIIGQKGSHVIDQEAAIAHNPLWFKSAGINFAENMLSCRSTEKVALIQATEPTPLHPTPEFRRCTYAELYELVAELVSSLLANDIKPGDRIAAYSSNSIETVALCLATTAIGAIWVSAAADFAPAGVVERFEQVQPRIIFAVSAVAYNGKLHDHIPKVKSLLAELSAKSVPSPKVVIMNSLPYAQDKSAWQEGWIGYPDFIRQGKAERRGLTVSGEILWHRTSFNWPLWILFSSGSTGRPKAIVHRAGGMLLQSKKELALCADLQPSDIFFYYTTTGWMMWNFLLGGLAVGCTLVLYDGSPLRDPALLWRLTDELGITIFGTSAKYIEHLASKGYKPCEHHDLKTLRHIYSTGSPLSAALFDYVYQDISANVLLGSITGGTDICSLFAGMCSALPVYRGEIQCRLLGMAIESYSEDGKCNPPDVAGELVCLKPFPCMPAGFWPLEGFSDDKAVAAAKARYHQAYFAQLEGVWYHGDHIVITSSRQGNGGGVVMLGRSDGVLNPGGVRFGTAELYDVIEAAFGTTGKIVDCLAVGQTISDSDERVVLFVKLPDGQVLDQTLEKTIKDEVRARRSARHVPGKIVQVGDIPYTVNGKKVEVIVRKIINGASPSIVNRATLANDCLELYEQLGVQLRAEYP
ncbi:Acetoacetyl-CoA synthetase [Mycena indigotica]|uniref:Acetoacetyl-CoA synthetase n=1 Tax=Mycena indigotica TaxID=2126181 RepID=A0A8H6W3L4_9AGAR|nr:Acetoacetyl-CoA synthetase [Mycena indigotica]KAF7301696.1 Acetoacetyl-CoA synthetase [Mycena indigotica]